MGTTFLQTRDRDVFWGIYKSRPLTTSEVAKAFFKGNTHNAARKLKDLRDRGYIVSQGGHLPPKDGQWNAGGRTELVHEVTIKALEEVCPLRGESIPKVWGFRWSPVK